MKQTIILKQNGDIITFNLDSINLNLCDDRFTNSLERTIPRRGFKESFDSIHKFYFKKSILVIWGYRDGNPTTENRHELPPPLDNTLLFGDCLVIQYDEYGNQTYERHENDYNGDGIADAIESFGSEFDEYGNMTSSMYASQLPSRAGYYFCHPWANNMGLNLW